MCKYSQSDHALPHWKCVLRCCADFPCINIPNHETYNNNSDTTPSIHFHIYHTIGRCIAHGRIPLKEKKIYYMYEQESLPDSSTKIYTRKELVMMDKTISDFHTCFFIPDIQKLAFNQPYVHILGTNHYGEMRRTAFKRRELFQDVLYRRDYADMLVSSFANQIQS